MSYREALKDRLIWEEGLKHKPYRCPAGKLTVGVGWNMDANPLPKSMQVYLDEHGELTLIMIMELLEKSIDKAEQDARSLFESFNDFSDNRKVAVVDLLFNLGRTSFSKFINTIAAIRHGNWDAAAAGLKNSKWYKQVQPERAEGIVKLITEG
jgi:lysozyme